jgi:hypothetical protein
VCETSSTRRRQVLHECVQRRTHLCRLRRARQDQRVDTVRGLQTTDSSGRVTFVAIYPGWYQGRATHIHVEVTLNGRSLKVTQIAFPEDVTAAVYRSGVYASSGQNPTTNARDNVFADGVADEMITITGGDPASGYTATFQVGVTL